MDGPEYDITANPEMGECAVEMLIKKIEGKIAPEKLTLPVKLIQRSSTERFHGKQENNKEKNEAVFTKATSFFFFISPLQNRL